MGVRTNSKKPGYKIGPDDSFYGWPGVVLQADKEWKYIAKKYKLSSREIDVARLVCRGLTNEDVAESLNLKRGTVKTHLKHIFIKTRARNRITMLLRFIEDSKLFSTSPHR